MTNETHHCWACDVNAWLGRAPRRLGSRLAIALLCTFAFDAGVILTIVAFGVAR